MTRTHKAVWILLTLYCIGRHGNQAASGRAAEGHGECDPATDYLCEPDKEKLVNFALPKYEPMKCSAIHTKLKAMREEPPIWTLYIILVTVTLLSFAGGFIWYRVNSRELNYRIEWEKNHVKEMLMSNVDFEREARERSTRRERLTSRGVSRGISREMQTPRDFSRVISREMFTPKGVSRSISREIQTPRDVSRGIRGEMQTQPLPPIVETKAPVVTFDATKSEEFKDSGGYRSLLPGTMSMKKLTWGGDSPPSRPSPRPSSRPKSKDTSPKPGESKHNVFDSRRTSLSRFKSDAMIFKSANPSMVSVSARSKKGDTMDERKALRKQKKREKQQFRELLAFDNTEVVDPSKEYKKKKKEKKKKKKKKE